MGSSGTGLNILRKSETGQQHTWKRLRKHSPTESVRPPWTSPGKKEEKVQLKVRRKNGEERTY